MSEPLDLAATRAEYDDDFESFDVGPHLYLVEFVGHCVKVGITDDVDQRIAAHQATARKLGREVGRIWVTPRHFEARRNEKALKGRSRDEYLRRDFDALVAQACALEMTQDDE